MKNVIPQRINVKPDLSSQTAARKLGEARLYKLLLISHLGQEKRICQGYAKSFISQELSRNVFNFKASRKTAKIRLLRKFQK